MHVLLPLIAFFGAAGLLTVTPGADTALVLRSAAAGGPKSAWGAALGVGLGCMVWGTGAAFGLTAILAASPLAFTLVKWAGAAYLTCLGLGLLFKPRGEFNSADRAPPPAAKSVKAFQRGCLTNLTNPKVGIFYITFLPQFIPSGVSVVWFSLLLALIQVGLGLLWFAVLIALTVPLGRFLRRPFVVRWMDRLTGVVFVGFGLKLASFEHR